jgi:GTPase SAR1 family protein
MSDLKITMLGPTGVGKTSLMAAMYDQFRRVTGNTELVLTTEDDSAKLLYARLNDLKTLPAGRFKAAGGVIGDREPSQFMFNLTRRGSQKSSIQFCFQDYPGGYHRDREAYIKEQLTQCVAVLIAIDATALMEEGGRWHDYINRPQQILELFENTYNDLDSPRLIILAPIKCETYMKDRDSANKLRRTLRERYASLLNHFRANALLPKVAIVITPVQTVGSVFFSEIKVLERDIEGKSEQEPQFFFSKLNVSDGYEPKGSEEPLRYLLSFLLKLHLDQKRWFFFDWIRSLFDKDVEFKDAICKFALASDRDGSSEIVQGELLLKID